MESVVPSERTRRPLRKALPRRIKSGLLLAMLIVLLAFHIAPVVTKGDADRDDLARRCAYLAKLIEEKRHPLDLDGDGSACPYLRTHALPLVAEDAKDRHAALCPYIQELSRQRREHAADSNFGKTLFAYLFPGNARVNSLLATFYISSVPNFILFFVPPDIKPSSLNTLVAFAVGGLLGDVFLHLLPQSFMGEVLDDQAHFVELDEKRNIVIGIGIFVGFATFFVIDRLMRVVNGGDGSHSHGHTRAHSQDDVDDVKDGSNDDNGKSTAITKHVTSTRQRTSPSPDDANDKGNKSIAVKDKSPSVSIRLSAYLNLIADATHNFTDGLAMAASFYASPTVGATTAIAVFFHEIPHEIGDYAILIQSGFTKRYALLSQFVTALGAFAGTLAGISIEEFSRSDPHHVNAAAADGGILGTGVPAGDLVIPFTAGGFLYIATVGVIPELLEVSGRMSKDLRQAFAEFAAMIVGVAAMALIS